MIYQLKIQIQGITKPPVWRRILIPSDVSFDDLHMVIQAAFDWENYHLYQFSKKPYDRGWSISNDNEEDMFGFGGMSQSLPAKDIAIQEYLNPACPKITYTYDFGDDWIHLITLEDADVKDCEDPKHAHCIAGKGVAPLEDCGGVYGFMELRDYIKANPEKALAAIEEEEKDYDDDDDEIDDVEVEEDDALDMVRWAGQFFELDKDGKPEFDKINVKAINLIVSCIPLKKVTGKSRKKKASNKESLLFDKLDGLRNSRGGKLTTEEKEEIQRLAGEIFGDIFGKDIDI